MAHDLSKLLINENQARNVDLTCGHAPPVYLQLLDLSLMFVNTSSGFAHDENVTLFSYSYYFHCYRECCGFVSHQVGNTVDTIISKSISENHGHDLSKTIP